MEGDMEESNDDGKEEQGTEGRGREGKE